MKRVVFITVAILVASAAFAAMGDVVGSWHSPANYPLAAARPNNDAYFWLYCNTSPYYIYQVNALTGAIAASYPSPYTSATRGLAYSYGGAPSGSYLWIGKYTSPYEYSMTNYSNGSIYASFAPGHSLYGLAPQATADGGNNPLSIITAYTSPNYVWLHHPTTGSIISSFAKSQLAYDIGWDWRNQVIWGGYGSPGVMYAWNTAGSLMTSFAMPAPYPYAVVYHASYLWVGCTIPDHYVYRIHCPLVPTLNIRPASVGKVKALFH